MSRMVSRSSPLRASANRKYIELLLPGIFTCNQKIPSVATGAQQIQASLAYLSAPSEPSSWLRANTPPDDASSRFVRHYLNSYA